MKFIDGFLGLLTAAGTGTFTEWSGGNYARQPVSFGSPVFGISKLATPYSFGVPQGAGVPGTIAGRAIFNSPTGAECLLILPLPAPISVPRSGPVDAKDVGGINLLFSYPIADLTAYATGDSYYGTVPSATAAGLCWDDRNVVGTYASPPNVDGAVTVLRTQSNVYLAVRGAPFSSYMVLLIQHGRLDVAFP